MIQYVPYEFRGLARSFRQQVETAERQYGDQWQAKVLSPLHQRLARKPTVRNGTAADIQRTLEALANPFRLSYNVDIPKRGHLRVTQIVVGTSRDKEDSWGEAWEDTIALLRITMSTERRVVVNTEPLATISGHAIARWFERTGTRDQSKLIADIAMILDAQDRGFAITSSGAWLGPVASTHVDIVGEAETRRRKMVIRNVRTFISADMVDTRIPYALEAAQ